MSLRKIIDFFSGKPRTELENKSREENKTSKLERVKSAIDVNVEQDLKSVEKDRNKHSFYYLKMKTGFGIQEVLDNTAPNFLKELESMPRNLGLGGKGAWVYEIVKDSGNPFDKNYDMFYIFWSDESSKNIVDQNLKNLKGLKGYEIVPCEENKEMVNHHMSRLTIMGTIESKWLSSGSFQDSVSTVFGVSPPSKEFLNTGFRNW